MTHVARREGIRGKLGNCRSVLVTADGEEVLVRSLELAKTIASALEVGTAAPGDASATPPARRYYAAEWKPGQPIVYCDDRGRDHGRSSPGLVARTSSRELAERIAAALNALDPAVFKPSPEGARIGWLAAEP